MKPSWIHLVRGKTARQARVDTVGRFNEELFGRGGFFGPTAMLYHRGSPSEFLRVEGDVKPRMTPIVTAATADLDDPRGDFTTYLENRHVSVGLSRRREAMPFCYRNVVGDLLYFVHTGRGVFATEFGPLAYEPGDYVLLPRGTTFRHFPEGDDGVLLVVQSLPAIRFTEHLQVGRHVPFDPAIIQAPDLVDYGWPGQDEWELRIKHHAGFTSVFVKNNPMDLIGWKGDLFPFKINIRDIIPLTSDRIHLAPSSWATFETDRFMIVTFVPQPAVRDLASEELPSNHRNVDCDEAIFVHADDQSRGGALLHMPQGFMHGSSESLRKAFNASRTADMQRQLTGVSVDSYEPLLATDAYRELCEPERLASRLPPP